MSRRITDATWTDPGHRPRGWQIVINQHEADSRAALIDPRCDPSFAATLRAAIANHPRFTRAAVIIIGCTTAAQLGAMLS